MFTIAKINYNGKTYQISTDVENKIRILSSFNEVFEIFGNWKTAHLENFNNFPIDIPEKYDILDIVKAFCKTILGDDPKQIFMADVISLWLSLRELEINKNDYLKIVAEL